MTQAQELSWEADGTRFTALHFFDSMTQQEIASITSYRDRQAFIRELCVPSEHVTGPAAQPTRAGAPTSPEAAAVEPRLESGQPAEGLPPPSPLDEFSPAPKRPRTRQAQARAAQCCCPLVVAHGIYADLSLSLSIAAGHLPI